jgi:tight adherence protein B
MQLRELAALLSAGIDLKTALEQVGFEKLPRELALAISLGAPVKTLLISLANQQESEQKAKAELGQALAVPRATRRLLLWLPFATLLFTLLLGISSMASLGNPLVLASLALGICLLILGNKITKRMLSGFSSDFYLAELQHFLIAVKSGMTTGEINKCFPHLLADARIQKLIELTNRTGASLGALIESEIENSLQTQLSEKVTALRQLSVRLLIPLGLTTLPAFMLFTIPPTMVGLTK